MTLFATRHASLCLWLGLVLTVQRAAAGETPQAPAAPPPAAEVEKSPWSLNLGGYVKLDAIYDFDPIGSTDNFDPRTIPIDGGEGTNSRLHARETRLSLMLVGPVEGHDLRLFVETDFYGSGNSLRLRHAFAEYRGWLVGQTWSMFMDETNIPPTVDFETPLAAPLVRTAMLRYTAPARRASDGRRRDRGERARGPAAAGGRREDREAGAGFHRTTALDGGRRPFSSRQLSRQVPLPSAGRRADRRHLVGSGALWALPPLRPRRRLRPGGLWARPRPLPRRRHHGT